MMEIGDTDNSLYRPLAVSPFKKLLNVYHKSVNQA